MTRRRRIPDRTDAALRRLFDRKVCVVTGDDQGAQWHHLDEDTSNWDAGNIVPVTGDLNRRLDAYRRDTERDPPMRIKDYRLTPDFLSLKASHWFRVGHAGRAYGASRLATRLMIQYAPLFEQDDLPVEAICQSLHALRHADHLWLLDDVLQRDVRWVVSRERLNPSRRALLLVEFASIYQDVLALDLARELLDEASGVLDSLAQPPLELQVRILRRSAINRIVIGDDLHRARYELDRAAEMAWHSDDWITVATARVCAAAACSRLSDAEELARDTVRRATTTKGLPNPLAAAPWAAIELLLSAATIGAADRRSRRSTAAADQLSMIVDDPEFAAIRLRPISLRLSGAASGSDSRALRLASRLTAHGDVTASVRKHIEELTKSIVGRR